MKYISLIIVSIIGFSSYLNANILVGYAESGDAIEVARHIRGGADVNNVGGSWTPLAIAAVKGHKNVVAVLLANGADPNRKGTQYEQPLIACARALADWYASGRADVYAEIAQMLIDAGADVNAANTNGDVPLDFAMLYKEAGHKLDPFIDVLLQNGANISFLRPTVTAEMRASLEKRQQELMAQRRPVEPEPVVKEVPSVIIKQPDAPKVSETTPWDTLPYGEHSARLHILKQLLKKTKNAAEKKTIMVMLEAEVANVFDLLQYDVKRAEVLIAKAKSKGKEDKAAKKLLANSKKHIKALLGYFKTLPKASRNRIDSIRLPSKDWAS